MATTQPAKARTPVTILHDGKSTTVSSARTAEGDVWLTLADLAAATGWALKPEGVCRSEVCIPIPPGKLDAWVREHDGETWFNVTDFASHIEQPVARDTQHNVCSFGPPSFEWQDRLPLQMAPDFTLPDFEGNPHSLSDYRGKKVFLVTWASW